MDNSLLMQGVELMLVGMGTVFVFLSTLVGATVLMSRLVRAFEPPPPAAGQSGPSLDEVAAISAAIAAHRSRGLKR